MFPLFLTIRDMPGTWAREVPRVVDLVENAPMFPETTMLR
jgi:hypothetical protein